MGLDNGIMLEINSTKKIKIPKCFVHEQWFDQGEYEICYWRKCWGIRNSIIVDVFEKSTHTDMYEFQITANDIPKIIAVLKFYDHKITWGQDNSMIWDYKRDHIHKQLKNNIKCLKELKKFLQKYQNEDIKCYFYDSY